MHDDLGSQKAEELSSIRSLLDGVIVMRERSRGFDMLLGSGVIPLLLS